jgi:hypothetical protein
MKCNTAAALLALSTPLVLLSPVESFSSSTFSHTQPTSSPHYLFRQSSFPLSRTQFATQNNLPDKRTASTSTSLSAAVPAVGAIAGALTGGILGGALHAIAGEFKTYHIIFPFCFESKFIVSYRQTDRPPRRFYSFTTHNAINKVHCYYVCFTRRSGFSPNFSSFSLLLYALHSHWMFLYLQAPITWQPYYHDAVVNAGTRQDGLEHCGEWAMAFRRLFWVSWPLD